MILIRVQKAKDRHKFPYGIFQAWGSLGDEVNRFQAIFGRLTDEPHIDFGDNWHDGVSIKEQDNQRFGWKIEWFKKHFKDEYSTKKRRMELYSALYNAGYRVVLVDVDKPFRHSEMQAVFNYKDVKVKKMTGKQFASLEF